MPRFCLNVDSHRERVTANLHAFIDRLPKDKPWQVEIDPLRKERTSKQNKALFGVAYVELSEQTGFTKNELHEYFCGEFFGWTERKLFGLTKRVPVRTTTTDENGKHDVVPTTVLAAMYDFIQQRAAENGMFVSDPDPLWNFRP